MCWFYLSVSDTNTCLQIRDARNAFDLLEERVGEREEDGSFVGRFIRVSEGRFQTLENLAEEFGNRMEGLAQGRCHCASPPAAVPSMPVSRASSVESQVSLGAIGGSSGGSGSGSPTIAVEAEAVPDEAEYPLMVPYQGTFIHRRPGLGWDLGEYQADVERILDFQAEQAEAEAIAWSIAHPMREPSIEGSHPPTPEEGRWAEFEA